MTYQRPIRSYVLRQGRFSPAQQNAVASLMPRYGIAYAPAPLVFPDAFGREAPVVAEVGFGMGETTASLARDNPGMNYLAIEVHGPGVGSLLKRLEADSIANVRVVQHDAVEVLRDMVPERSLAAIHVFFPDPWPKKRHHKRRLLQPAFVGLAATRLAPSGIIHVATDWEEYAQQVLAVLADTPILENTAEGFAPRPAWRPQTKFERRGTALGHGVWDIIFRRRGP
ncbi:MAG TPA: tRNA (guanosine(46)-N7)-methyltransferase TrmB [Usitatibacter sp.]|nr:tRNA (guanosine(46)-N7)-methyltransferase TrmB [Usitatibacter sp.]